MQLVYFASPMCSWCWGFSPVMKKIQNEYLNSLHVKLVLTPFRIDNDEPMDKSLREYVLGQWSKVHSTTLQPFNFAFKVPSDFVYNTTLACLAIKAFSIQQLSNELNYLSAIQKDFYTENSNVTDADVLIGLAKSFDINIEKFKKDLWSSRSATLLQEDFSCCNKLGIRAYPTLIFLKNNKISTIASGYSPYEDCKRKIENDLN